MTDHQAENEIRRQETRRFEAIVRGDAAALEEILSDDLTYTHTSGVYETKAVFIGKLRSGELRYESFTPEDIRVRVYGTMGVVTGVARVRVQVKGEPLSFQLRFTDVYVQQEGQWQMVAWQATRLP